MKGSVLKYWLLMAGLLLAFYGSFIGWRKYEAAQADAPSINGAGAHALNLAASREPTAGPLPAFTLTDQTGQPFNTESLRGQVWVASFFYANCPAICWRLNQALADLQHGGFPSVDLVSITCDPDNDTPAALEAYAKRFQADAEHWRFLTGSMDEIRKIGHDIFMVAVEKETHSGRAIVIDRQGVVRGRYSMTEPAELARMQKLLAALQADAGT